MSGSDSYILAKSLEPQGVTEHSPFESETWNYIPDLNSGIYASSGLSLVQFDLSSIYSSSALVDLTSAYLAIPLTIVTQGVTGAAVPLPVFTSTNAAANGSSTNMWQWAGLKPGFLNLLHAAEFSVNSQQVEQYQPYNNIHSYAKWCSMASQDDQNVFCESLGFGRQALDNPLSYKYNGSSSTVAAGATFASFTTTTQLGIFGGNGLSNCAPYAMGGSTLNTSGLPNSGDQSAVGVQVNPSLYNNNYYYRLNSTVETTASNNFVGSSTVAGDMYGTTGISTSNNITTEMRNNFSIQQGSGNSYGVSQQVAIIRLCDILDSCKNMPLTKRISGTLRLYFNTGSCWINGVGAGGGTGGGTGLFSGANTSFTNTCPLLISQLLNTNANVVSQPYTGATALNGATPAYVQSIAAALFVGKCTGTTIGNFTFPAFSSNLIPSCRLYYPQIKLKVEKMKLYLDMGLNKKVCYAPYLFNFYQNIAAGGQFSQLLQSGIKRPKGLMLLPYISSSTNGLVTTISGITPFSPLLSPFDTSPTSTGPISIVNLQVALGGQNQIQNIVQQSWEQFIEYTSNYNKLNGIDLGIKCGVFNQFTFENYFRMYYIDLSRSTLAEAMTTRNLTISFLNNSNVAIDTYIFTEYYDEFEINVENGLITK